MSSAAKQVFSRVYRPQIFPQKIVLSDGSTITKLTTSPRSSVRLTKDIRNAQLYNPDAGASLNQEENKRLAKFKGRFDGFETATSEGDDLAWMTSLQAKAAPKMSEREIKEAGRRKPSKTKK